MARWQGPKWMSNLFESLGQNQGLQRGHHIKANIFGKFSGELFPLMFRETKSERVRNLQPRDLLETSMKFIQLKFYVRELWIFFFARADFSEFMVYVYLRGPTCCTCKLIIKHTFRPLQPGQLTKAGLLPDIWDFRFRLHHYAGNPRRRAEWVWASVGVGNAKVSHIAAGWILVQYS